MAREAKENVNAPADEHVQAAVRDIEERYTELASARGSYMQQCRRIRENMAGHYETAGHHGISKKLLKKIVKERELERKIDGLTADLEPDEISEHQMLLEKLGEFANTPLGAAAVARSDGKTVLKQVGA